MPTFPRYSSKAQLTTQAPSVQAPEDTTGEIIQKVGEVGNVLQKATITYSNALDSMQESRSNLNYKTGVLEEQQKFENIPNPTPEDYEKTRKEIQKLGINNLKGFSNKTAETKMTMEFAYQEKVAIAQIENSYKKKQIIGWRADTIGLLDLEIAKGADNLEGRLDTIIDPIQNLGGYDKLEALNLKKEYLKKGKFNSFLNDINTNLGMANNNVTKNTYDFDSATLLRAKNIYSHAVNVENAQTTHELIDMSNNGLDITVPLEQAFLTKRISNSTYKALEDKTNSPVGPTSRTDPKTYYDITHYLLNPNADTEKATNDILEAQAKGKLSPKDARKIYDMALAPKDGTYKSLNQINSENFEQVKEESDLKVAEIKERRSYIRLAQDVFDDYFNEGNEKEVVESMQLLIDALLEGSIKVEDVPRVAEQIKARNNLKRKPAWAALPKEGRTGYDQFGNKVVVYPDGRVVRAE